MSDMQLLRLLLFLKEAASYKSAGNPNALWTDLVMPWHQYIKEGPVAEYDSKYAKHRLAISHLFHLLVKLNITKVSYVGNTGWNSRDKYVRRIITK